MSSHTGWRIALICAGFLVYAITLFISYCSSNPSIDIGIFLNETGTISDHFYLSITPAGWTFGVIWAIIYVYQAVWYLYALTTICRRDKHGQYLYTLSYMPPALYIVFIINNIVIVAWLVLWDRQWIEWALLDIIFTPLTLYICLFLSFKYLYDNIMSLKRGEAGKEIWFVRILVQNGLAFFATWVSIATLLNFAMVLTYTWSVEMQIASSVALGILTLDIVVWFTLDNFFVDKFVRYTITPYIVLVIALVGSILKNFDLDTNYRNSVFTAVLLGVAGLLLIVKLTIVVVRHRKYPIKGNVNDDVKGTFV